ncbi:DUF2933 domain-containing protein [Cytobacillus sp. Hm23]
MLLLILLICPLMMLFMHGSHKDHKHGDKNHGHHKNHNHVNEHSDNFNGDNRLESYKVKQLEGEIQYLKDQNKLLQKK